MTKELEGKLIGLIGELEKGVEFGKEQAPIIVEQLLTYELMISSFWVFVGCICLGISIWFLIKFIKNQLDDKYIMGCIFFVVLALLALSEIITILKITIAPNLFALDYIRGII